ncbi:MAG: tRNA (adenosine(37)-N6)-dimethylallyltransferase MiaA, partial [Sedimenticola sp.]
IDPVAAARIHPNDPQRIQRALEVYELTGRSLTDMQGESVGEPVPYRLIKLARVPNERAQLHKRIAERFEMMLTQGFEEEVRRLLQRGDLTPELPSMRSVGYRQMLKYLLGEWDWETMKERGVIATRQLAKRQLTWLRSDPGVHWLDENSDNITNQALKIIGQSLT